MEKCDLHSDLDVAKEALMTVPLQGNIPLEMVPVIVTEDAKQKATTGKWAKYPTPLSEDYWIGKYPVTQAQWKAVMGNTPSKFPGATKPVECVSWEDARDFCLKLNILTRGKRPEGYQFSLPTEAQWVYAAQGGQKCSVHPDIFAGGNNPDSVAWCAGNNAHTGTHPVGQKVANPLGLFDMSGNVWEWCQEEYGHYPHNPHPPRYRHGGGWDTPERCCEIEYRGHLVAGARKPNLGFRLALVKIR